MEFIYGWASGLIGSGARILWKGLDGFKVCYTLHFDFLASNNMVEYKALVKSMQIAMEVRATDLRINSDSQLVVNQIKRVCQAKDLIMQKYLGRVWELERELNEQGIIVRYE